MNQQRKIVVVGGGAAGMMAALFAARTGAHVILLERNEKLGKKVYITGKGRCNLTNNADMDQFMRCIVRNPRFMYAAFACLDNQSLKSMVEQMGVPLKVERGERVFPVSDKSSDIIRAFEMMLRREGVDVRCHSRVQSIQRKLGKCTGVVLENGEAIAADAVILATGGVSYPSTGSTGDGIDMARTAGHVILPLMPALVPIETAESWPAVLSGLSLKNVRLSAYQAREGKKEKKLYSEMGEMLFTHFGISGPLVLTLSSLLPEELSGVRFEIDLKPALDMQTLDARLLRDFREFSRKQLISVMDGLEPHSLAEQILKLAKMSAAAPVNGVTAQERERLLSLIKGLPLTPKKLRGFDEAIVTRGGVSVKDINPSTMASKKVDGLYFAGEMMDVDAQTGGFNLQIAFSSGALAGRSAALGER